MQPALAALTAFNLICSVTDAGREATATDSKDVVYRVDLRSGYWCSNDCSFVHPLAGLSAEEIVFQQDIMGFVGWGIDERVNRSTGRHVSIFIDFNERPPRTTRSIGHCERAPFSGFPRGRLDGLSRLRPPPPRMKLTPED